MIVCHLGDRGRQGWECDALCVIPAGNDKAYVPTVCSIWSSNHSQDTAMWFRAEMRSMLNPTLPEM
jgi:hypothetical protein